MPRERAYGISKRKPISMDLNSQGHLSQSESVKGRDSEVHHRAETLKSGRT